MNSSIEILDRIIADERRKNIQGGASAYGRGVLDGVIKARDALEDAGFRRGLGIIQAYREGGLG